MTDSKHAAVRDWLLQCPSIPRLGFHFAQAADGETMIVPSDTLRCEYIDGSQERRYAFELARFLPISTQCGEAFPVPGNIDMQEEMDSLARWVEAQNTAGNLPAFPPNCIVHEAAVLNTEAPYIAAQDESLAKYMIPFAIDYLLTV